MRERRFLPELARYPELMDLVNAFLVARSCGQPPWALGKDMPRRRFYQTAAIFAPYFELTHLWRQCPLLETE